MRLPVFTLFSLLALGISLLGLSGCAAGGANGGRTDLISRVWTEFRDAESFAHFGEFRATDAEPGGAVILRSQPDERTGFYFSMRLQAGAAGATVPDGRIVLSVVAPDAAEPKSYEFPFTTGARRSVHVLTGLTGTDWPHGPTMPLAWKIQVLDTAGRTVAERQSFLWAQP